MSPRFAAPSETARPIHVTSPETLKQTLDGLPETARSWVDSQNFSAGPGEILALPGPDGRVVAALAGLGAESARPRHRFALARAASALPGGDWRFDGDLDPDAATEASLGWLLEGYRFDRYKSQEAPKARLVAPEGIDAARVEAMAEGEYLTRDLINTPASDMGPDELEVAARALAERFGAEIEVTTGDALLDANFPLIHTVGRAAPRAPRLIDLRWGDSGPTLTLVGKGVCFDTGGLNLKPGASMGLMKKDMGGAANVLGLAHMLMATGSEIRLRVLIPAVENAVSGNAFRPGDILTSRKGLTVEINNTDAEGRLVLADALALADETPSDLVLSMATLTGAARVAVGPDLAPFYATEDRDAQTLSGAAVHVADPVWRMPFHEPYEAMIEPGIADLDNAPSGGMAGSITAALFLRRFVTETPRYMHFDIYGWCPTPAPGRSKGGALQGARALFQAMPELLAK
ncbi:leucyl aminopeptidase family protein [Histidinibacterium aquaticum]|uniref:Leucyl aminopeptidase family protein n=1 Tax=Histidinibacterium aquaticum TaxID=2613962 RepID=A0A5J5GFI5_9RHOB|nr:leucyl aminopeptidase family protein [Histidinibacterium aquaticum]KAA9007006.1 leucyl aminopeptidase family protein [Histidinibacterium aquaticum]